jgi:hypothetical protein
MLRYLYRKNTVFFVFTLNTDRIIDLRKTSGLKPDIEDSSDDLRDLTN